jgi:hypothetical protein
MSSRSSPLPTESTSSIPLSFVLDVSTGKSSSLYQQRRLVPRSWSEFFDASTRVARGNADLSFSSLVAQDSLAQDEGQPQGQLRGAGEDDGRVQWSSVEGEFRVLGLGALILGSRSSALIPSSLSPTGRLRRGWYDCTEGRLGCHWPRALHFGYLGGSGAFLEVRARFLVVVAELTFSFLSLPLSCITVEEEERSGEL